MTIDRSLVPHLDQYFGAWAVKEDFVSTLLGKWDAIRECGLAAHANSPEYRAAIEQASAPAVPSRAPGSSNLAVVNLHGVLMKHVSSLSMGTSTVLARKQIRAAVNDPEIGGLLIHVDSPGGTAAGTPDLADEIRAADAKMPVFAYIEDLGASAAYFAASQARKVYSNASGLIGSIGTFSVLIDESQAAAAEGIKVHVIRAGAFKGTGVPGTEITDAQLAEAQRVVNEINDFFLQSVARGRGLSRGAVNALADGRVHVGQAAADLRLTDGVRTLDDTIRELSQAVAATQRPASQSSSTHGGHPMSEPNAAAEPAATAQELKAALPGADAVFLFDQLVRGATLQQAKDAFLHNQAEQLKMRDAEIEELKSSKPITFERLTTKPLMPPGPAVGLAALDDDASGAMEFADARAQFRAEIDKKVRGGMTRPRAVSQVRREKPELAQAVVDQANGR